MNVIVFVSDSGHLREAIPVRALPFVAPSELHPEGIAYDFAGSGRDITLCALQSYYRGDGGGTRLVISKEWDAIVTRLLSLSVELDTAGNPRETDDRGCLIDNPMRDDEYILQAIPRLPQGVFVWRDEFEEAYWRHVNAREQQWERDLCDALGDPLPPLRLDDFAPIYTPLIPDELAPSILAGFEQCEKPPPAAAHGQDPALGPQPDAPPDNRPTTPPQADTTAITGKPIKVPLRQDALTKELLEILRAMNQRGEHITPVAVMRELNRRAKLDGSCIEKAERTWVTWMGRRSGKTKTLDMEALDKRIRRLLDDKGTLRGR